MKHFIPAFALLISSLFAPVAASAAVAPFVCNGPSGLVYILQLSCVQSNVGVFPAANVGQCLVVQNDLSLGFAACVGSGFVSSVSASAPLASSGGATPNISLTGIVPIANGGTGSAAPSETAGSGISITGTWPFLTVTNTAPSSGGTVTSVTATGPNLTSTGGTTPNIALAAAPAISGTNFTLTSIPDAALITAPVTTVTAGGVLASTGGVTPNITFTGILPVANGGTGSATPSETAGTGISITGTWPFLTVTNTSPSSGGTVTAVTGTAPIVSSGGATPAISCATCVTSVTASTNILSSGGTTPNITLVASPTVTSLTATGSPSITIPVGGTIGNNTASANILDFGTSGQNTYFELFNPTISATTEIATTGSTAGGIGSTLLSVAYSGHNNLFALDSSGNLGLGGSISPLHVNQSAASQFAKRVALSSGTTTFTFPTAYLNTPVCVATPEGTLALGLLQVAPTTTACVVTSAVGSDTRTVDILVIGNPN